MNLHIGKMLYPTNYYFYRFGDIFEIKEIPVEAGSEETFIALTAQSGFILDVEFSKSIIMSEFTDDINRSFRPTNEQVEYINTWLR